MLCSRRPPDVIQIIFVMIIVISLFRVHFFQTKRCFWRVLIKNFKISNCWIHCFGCYSISTQNLYLFFKIINHYSLFQNWDESLELILFRWSPSGQLRCIKNLVSLMSNPQNHAGWSNSNLIEYIYIDWQNDHFRQSIFQLFIWLCFFIFDPRSYVTLTWRNNLKT